MLPRLHGAAGFPYFTFHDADVMATAHTCARTRRTWLTSSRLSRPHGVDRSEAALGTANLFSHPRYAAGAATSPDPEVFAYAAAQVRCCLETTHRLGGENYVLWGGREGYDTLLNTEMSTEVDHLARFLTMVVEHKHKIGFTAPSCSSPSRSSPPSTSTTVMSPRSSPSSSGTGWRKR